MDDTKTCGTCKFRGKEIEGLDDDDDSFNIKAKGYFECERIKHDEYKKYKQGQKALVIDGSGYYAALCVENDFGCAAWEERANV